MVSGPKKLPIPNPHGGGEISVGKLREILREIGVSPEEWNAADYRVLASSPCNAGKPSCRFKEISIHPDNALSSSAKASRLESPKTIKLAKPGIFAE